MTTEMEAPSTIPRSTVSLMAISVGVIVGNIYYIQPLLAALAGEFHLSVPDAGAVAMMMQIGTATGMLLFVPLGDTHERRGLVTALLVAAAVALVVFATARNLPWLLLGAVTLGLFSATVHVIVPYAAHLAPPTQRGKVLGFVFSGLLFGILLARTFSGYVGAAWGWRSVFWIAASAMLLLAILIRLRLPVSNPEIDLAWVDLVRSTLGLVRKHAILREAAFQGAVSFAAFSAFWTTLTFRLDTPPFHYGSTVAGLFGLVGAAGAAGAPVVGRLADKHGPRRAVVVAMALSIVALLIMGFGGSTLTGLVVGVAVLDLGIQATHVANQTRIYALDAKARSRLNMFYMVCYFVGGAIGSYLGAIAWRHLGWWGVCGFGIIAIMPGFWWATSRSRS